MDTTNSSENQKRRVEDRKPSETIDWEAPGAPAVPQPIAHPIGQLSPTRIESPIGAAPAATSGDAPDLQQLKALALAATPGKWVHRFDPGNPAGVQHGVKLEGEHGCWVADFLDNADRSTVGGGAGERNAAFVAAANPAVVLGLIAQVESFYNAMRLWKQKAEGVARIESAAAPALVEKKAYGPDNPPRLRKDGESVRDYRIAMGWDAPPAAAPATASGDELPSIDTPEFAHLLCELFTAKSGSPSNDARAALVAYINAQARAAVSAATKPTEEGDFANKSRAELIAYIEYLRDTATKPSADLSKLLKFDLVEYSKGGWYLRPRESGSWVKVEDVQSLLATKPTADSELEYNATRLRNVAKLVGLGSSIPEDDATLDGARGSVLGLIAGALRNAATKPTADLSKLTRYGTGAIGMGGEFGPDLRGDFVRFADVQSLLATKPAAAPAGRILAKVTKEMRIAGLAEANRRDCDADSSDVEMIFEAMLAAAPAASTTGAAQTAEQVRMAEIGQLIATQDNRITEAPIFVVEQKTPVVSDSDYNDCRVEWRETENGDYQLASPERAERLEALHRAGRETPGWRRYEMADIWTFVTACFTEQGCLDYLTRNGHNLRETRIYAYGSYRNEEFRAIRNFLMSLRPTPTHSSEAGDAS